MGASTRAPSSLSMALPGCTATVPPFRGRRARSHDQASPHPGPRARPRAGSVRRLRRAVLHHYRRPNGGWAQAGGDPTGAHGTWPTTLRSGQVPKSVHLLNPFSVTISPNGGVRATRARPWSTETRSRCATRGASSKGAATASTTTSTATPSPETSSASPSSRRERMQGPRCREHPHDPGVQALRMTGRPSRPARRSGKARSLRTPSRWAPERTTPPDSPCEIPRRTYAERPCVNRTINPDYR
jgi:hypothetical protein